MAKDRSLDYLYQRKAKKSFRVHLMELSDAHIFEVFRGKPMPKEPTRPVYKENGKVSTFLLKLLGTDLKRDYEIQLTKFYKEMEEYKNSILEARNEVAIMRRKIGDDPDLLLYCFGGRELSPPEFDYAFKAGYVSEAEIKLVQKLYQKLKPHYKVYHQVEFNCLSNPVDIVAVSLKFGIFVIELDGRHHLFKDQKICDARREDVLLCLGINVIRVGYTKFVESCDDTVSEILSIITEID